MLLQLDDAKREIDLTIEARVQESLVNVRAKAKLEAEESLKLKVTTARLNKVERCMGCFENRGRHDGRARPEW